MDNPYFEAAQMPASGRWAARRNLSDRVRSLLQAVPRCDAPEAELERIAAEVERLAAELNEHPATKEAWGFAESANAGDVGAFFDRSPLIGLSNPLSPPLALWSEGGAIVGTGVFGPAYEGPPGCVHGGFVAAAFDEALGMAQTLTEQPGMTGTLEVRYVAPTPLGVELRFEARVDRTDGRKTFASGRLCAGTTLCAEARAVFVRIDPERFAELRAGAGGGQGD